MVVLIMTNAQLSISCFERNGIFTSSYTSFSSRWRPIFGVALNTTNSNKKITILGSPTATLSCENISALLKKESAGGGVLEKELQFKPCFDEYLKAMESVKTGKEKKQGHHKSNRYESKNDDLRDEDTLKWNNKFEGNLDQEKKTPKNGKFGYKERRIRELNGKESGMVRTKPRGETTDVGKKTRAGNAQVRTVVSYSVKNNRSSINKKGNFGRDETSSKFLVDRREVGFRSNEMGGIEVEQVEDRKLSRSNKAFLEKGEDNNGLEVERAAFKTFADVLDKPRVSQREMEERIQKLAMRLNGADIDMPEWMFSKTIRSAKIKYTDHSILRVIQILGKLGNWRRVLQVIEWLQMCERFKSHKLRYIYTTALDVLGKARRPVEALNVFHVMQQQMSSYPDLVAYHCIAVTLGQAGHMKELFDVIDSMRSPPKKKFKTGALGKWDPCLEPDIVVYNAILNACVQQKQWEGAFWVLQQLKQQGQQPSTTTYGLVMEVMFACGKYNLVHEFFRKIEKSSIPNALAYKVLVNTLWREGKTDEAVLAVQDMERRGIVGSAALYYDLARCLCSAGRCQEALMQIEKICKVANKPLVVTYTGLIQACLDSGNIQNGVYIFNRMKDFCSPNLVTCNIMLKAYLEHGLSEEAKELFQKMLDGKHISSKSDYKVRVIPDIFTFNTMLDACIEEKRWSDLEYVYERMLHRGYHFNSKRHLRMILDASRAGKGELLETTWKHLAQADRIPPLPLIKERFCVKLEKGDHVSAISCITSQPVSELQAFSKGAWLNLFKENAQRFRMDSLVQLIDEVNILIARSDSPKPVLQNLITSCKEFLRTHMTVAGIN